MTIRKKTPDVGSELLRVYLELSEGQVDLAQDAKAALYENLWDLYV